MYKEEILEDTKDKGIETPSSIGDSPSEQVEETNVGIDDVEDAIVEEVEELEEDLGEKEDSETALNDIEDAELVGEKDTEDINQADEQTNVEIEQSSDISDEPIHNERKNKSTNRLWGLMLAIFLGGIVLVVVAFLNPSGTTDETSQQTKENTKEVETTEEVKKASSVEEFNRVMKELRAQDFVIGLSFRKAEIGSNVKSEATASNSSMTDNSGIQWYSIMNSTGEVLGYSEIRGTFEDEPLEIQEAYRYSQKEDGSWEYLSELYDSKDSIMSGVFDATKNEKYTGTDLVLAEITYLKPDAEYETALDKNKSEYVSKISGKSTLDGKEYSIYLNEDGKVLSIEYLETSGDSGVYRLYYPDGDHYNSNNDTIYKNIREHSNLLKEEDEKFNGLIGKKISEIDTKIFGVDTAEVKNKAYEYGQTETIQITYKPSKVTKSLLVVNKLDKEVDINEMTILEIN